MMAERRREPMTAESHCTRAFMRMKAEVAQAPHATSRRASSFPNHTYDKHGRAGRKKQHGFTTKATNGTHRSDPRGAGGALRAGRGGTRARPVELLVGVQVYIPSRRSATRALPRGFKQSYGTRLGSKRRARWTCHGDCASTSAASMLERLARLATLHTILWNSMLIYKLL